MAHDEWKKSLPDGRVAHFVYDEVAEVCAATLKLGEFVRSRSSLKGPLTRQQVEELFAHELHLAARHSAGS